MGWGGGRLQWGRKGSRGMGRGISRERGGDIRGRHERQTGREAKR